MAAARGFALLGRRAFAGAAFQATRVESTLLRNTCRRHASQSSKSSVESSERRLLSLKYAAAGVAALGLASAIFYTPGALRAEAPGKSFEPKETKSEEDKPEGTKESLQVFRLAEVQKHDERADRKWVTKGNKVYDITDWIPAHPGGNVILRAVGGPIDKYWDVFTLHKKQDVYDILDMYLIGEIDKRDLVDGKVPAHEIGDPFETDPERDSRLKVHTEHPCNAETPGEGLHSYITPTELFYVRNHLWVPTEEEGKKHNLVIELPDGEEKEYSLADLKKNFKEVTVTATLQCSGNRRRHMSEEARPAQGLQWGVGAISTANWTGVRLRDVLRDAGFDVDATEWEDGVRHAQFVGAEAYGASIPVEKACDRRGDVLIAYAMNGQALPRDHGYPMRVLVPGHVAARSVKWVTRVVLSADESPSQWQRRDYKCFGPNQRRPDWDAAPAIQETPVQSAITSLRECSPHDAAGGRMLRAYGLEEESVAVEGYCFAGGGRRIARVDVSTDDGRTWHQAEILPDQAQGGYKAWAWRRWRFVLPRDQVGRCFVVKAVDEANNSQPGRYEPYYNFRGNLTNSWHRVGYTATRY